MSDICILPYLAGLPERASRDTLKPAVGMNVLLHVWADFGGHLEASCRLNVFGPRGTFWRQLLRMSLGFGGHAGASCQIYMFCCMPGRPSGDSLEPAVGYRRFA